MTWERVQNLVKCGLKSTIETKLTIVLEQLGFENFDQWLFN